MSASFLSTGRGKLILLLLCGVAFLDLVDASIVNVALPSIRNDLDFSTQGLQWVPSGYLLTYGGFMLLGGRFSDLFGRRRVLVTGTVIFALSSLAGGFANSAGLLVGARLAQGVGAALMMPAALSLLTTTFKEGADRTKAFGAWGAVAGLASAVGVLAGGLLTDGPGWRWVMFVNPPVCVLILAGAYRMFEREERRSLKGLDLVGAFLATAGMLLLVFALVKAPDQGWGSARTVLELAGAGVLLLVFVLNERVHRDPLLPLGLFRIRGLAAADVTQLVGVAGFLSMFFFLTLYMQGVLGYSPIRTGLAYLPVTGAVGIGAGIAPKLVAKVGTRPVAAVGLAVAAVGIFLLSRLKVDGSFTTGLLPGMVIMAVGLGFMFVAISTAANAGVPHHQAGVAAALLNASQQVGGALGLAIFSAISTARQEHQLKHGVAQPAAFTSGLSWALTACAVAVACAALIALRTRNVHSEAEAEGLAEVEDLVAVG